MTKDRELMELKGFPAPAVGVEERSDETATAGAAAPPDPEVVAKPKRRLFTAAYRLRVLEEADRCTEPGEVGRLLRRCKAALKIDPPSASKNDPPEKGKKVSFCA